MSQPARILSAVSYQTDPGLAAAELATQLCKPGIGFVLFFCASNYPLPALARALKQQFGELPLAGCTTVGQITPQGYDCNSILAIGFDDARFVIEGQLVRDFNRFCLSDAQTAVARLRASCSERGQRPVTDNTFALTLLDGLSVQDELVLGMLDTVLGSIPHFGGSAARVQNLSDTHVYFDGVFHGEAALLLLFNTSSPFKVFSSHHLTPADGKLVVTQARSEQRCVLEFNAEPAAVAYARAIGVSVESLNREVFTLHPIAVRAGERYYVRSIQKVNDDLSLTFYCTLEEGAVLTVMNVGDIVQTTQDVLESVARDVGEPEIIIGCDCALRRMELEFTDRLAPVNALLQHFQVRGFNACGEQFAGVHLNQTLTGVAIGCA